MYEYRATIVQIHDGDTIRLNVDLGFQIHQVDLDCRFLGYDAPELARPDSLGERARGAIVAWLVAHPPPYTVVTAKDATEKYGRYLIASLTATDGHELLNDQIAAGWLKPYSGRGPKPLWP